MWRSLPVAERWFERQSHPNGILQLWEPHVHELGRSNMWHVRGRDRDLIVDTGVGVASLSAELADVLDRPVVCVVTHSHFDHVGNFHEFDDRRIHPLEASDMQPFRQNFPLLLSEHGETTEIEWLTSWLEENGYPLDSELFIDALPHTEYDPRGFTITPGAPTSLIDEGDVIDLGDRTFEVIHLPGHSRGSIGLWEAATGTLFSGDAIYDGPLIDDLPESDRTAYVQTMRRLREMPVDIVHAGHDPSFGRKRLIALVDAYLAEHG